MSAVKSAMKLRAASALLLAATLLPNAASAASDATGVWFNDTGRGAVEIKPCGEGLCGHVVWVKDGGDAKGCGRQIIGDAQPSGAGVWDNGWIYSPERKKRYDVELKPLDNDRLRVTGYAGSKLFSKTMIWKRAPADLVRCGSETATAPTAPAAPVQAATTPLETATAPAIQPSEPATDRHSREARLRDEINKMNAAASAPAPAPTTTVAAEPVDDATTGEETADAGGGLDLGSLKLDKYLKRDNGKCALDLPWVKVAFNCEEK